MTFRRSLLLWCAVASVAQAADTPPIAVVEPPPAEKSLWEAGLVGGGSYLPDYPAADQSRFKWFVAPYAVYRGRILRVDREGARARILSSKYYETDISFAVSFASRSKDNRARQGMPDLDYLFEMGPRLALTLSRLGGRGKLNLLLPLRAVFSTNLGDFQHRGYTSTPALHARWRMGRARDRFAICQLTSSFGNRQISGYFYDVAPAFVTADRQAYDARGGYLGSDLFVGVLLPAGSPRLRFFSGAQGLVHSASANEASPLFRRHLNYSVVGGLLWTFLESKQPAVPLD